MVFGELAVADPRELVFGMAPRPVKTRRGLLIGAGTVYPELNFTLPVMNIDDDTLPEFRRHYAEAVAEALQRARELHCEGVVFEFETLLEMTRRPQIGIDLNRIMNNICEEWFAKHGMKSELRLTPNDTRDFDRPPQMRTGGHMAEMLGLFEGGALAGGDTACGFANTAMALAEQGYISRMFAAIDRVISVVRTLVAHEEGALGPDKDCGYEGPYLKAIAGIPISMEGRTAACAHPSPVGNIASAACDLWSNESIQHIKLLGGMATTISLEQLIYDVRLMNRAAQHGPDVRRMFRDLNGESDAPFDPQAVVLEPEVVVDVAGRMVAGAHPIDAAKRGALRALEILAERYRDSALALPDREAVYIDRMREDLEGIPEDESEFVEMMLPELDPAKVVLKEYGL